MLQKDGQKRSLWSRFASYCNRFNVVLLLLWALVLGLGMYISTIQLEVEPFNPFTILGLEETATESEIKKAYKKLVIVHHPDKVKDPILKKEAETFFAEKLAKAYQALTDDTARENWIKYGHPDGPQVLLPCLLPTHSILRYLLVKYWVLLHLSDCCFWAKVQTPCCGPTDGTAVLRYCVRIHAVRTVV